MGQETGQWTRLFTRANQLLQASTHPAEVRLPVQGQLPGFEGATGWLNSSPLTRADLAGRVVLVNFWTYTCINWLRSLPYVRAWADRYQDQGLVVVGVHTPEFDFEHDLHHLRPQVTDLRVRYPVAIDNDSAIWTAFDNHYWPASYLIDRQGQLRHHRFGEGDYQLSEMVLRQLLAEAGHPPDQPLAAVEATGVEAAADWASLHSPENSLGSGRTQNFASSDGAVLDTPQVYAAPTRLPLNHWALSGDWTHRRQAVVLNQAGGRLLYRFWARDLHLVMAPATPRTPVRFQVRLDGQPPGPAHGSDIDDQGTGTLVAPRLYQLLRQPPPATEHSLEVSFQDPGVQAYAVTFG